MAGKGGRIGFVDYKLDNWHANTFLRIIRNNLKKRGFDVAGCTGLDAKGGRAWAKKNSIPYYDTPEALNEAVDNFMILAPSNPERHLELCKMVFPFGKATYVDKTFAPDVKTAGAIFALADKHRTKIQTTSALRYTNVQDYVAEIGRAKVRHMVAWGPGGSFGEYAIHPVELVVSCMGPRAERLMRRGTGNESQLLVDFSGGRTAVINVYTKAETPYAASVTTRKDTRIIEVDGEAMFVNNASAIMDLFETGKPVIARAESLMVRRILDVAEKASALKGFVKL